MASVMMALAKVVSTSPIRQSVALRVPPRDIVADACTHRLRIGLSIAQTLKTSYCVMLWSRCSLPRTSCAARYKASPSQVLLSHNSTPTAQAAFASRDSRSLYKHWNPPVRDHTRSRTMAPKQSTLGYVRPSQQTLGCAFSAPHQESEQSGETDRDIASSSAIRTGPPKLHLSSRSSSTRPKRIASLKRRMGRQRQ